MKKKLRSHKWFGGSNETGIHVAPEAAVGGMLAFVKNRDKITIDVANMKVAI